MDTRSDPRVHGARMITEGEFLIFHRYADPAEPLLGADEEEVVAELMALTRRSKSFIYRGIHGYARLRDLPALRALQHKEKILDIARLDAIDRTLSVLPETTTAEAWAIFDTALVAMFTLTRPGQLLPSIWAITRKLRRTIATIDATVNFNPVARAKRENAPSPANEASFFPIPHEHGQRHGMELITNGATMACIRARVKAVAREHKLSLADTLVKLLAGDITTSVQPVLSLYAPATSHGSIHIDGFGWANSDDLETLYALFDATPPRVTSAADVAAKRVAGYRPTPAMADYVRHRDGTCVFPDCHQSAEACQLDHRIPYTQGGATTPDNLYSLCQTHHNLKTDRRAFYVPDPRTGDTIWLFADGTWIASENKGIFRDQITPATPRWTTPISDRRRSRAHHARFNAACHTLCDRYDVDGDLDSCLAGIKKLEREYGLTFAFTPTPDPSLPPEPPVEEPPIPDPEEPPAASLPPEFAFAA